MAIYTYMHLTTVRYTDYMYHLNDSSTCACTYMYMYMFVSVFEITKVNGCTEITGTVHVPITYKYMYTLSNH